VCVRGTHGLMFPPIRVLFLLFVECFCVCAGFFFSNYDLTRHDAFDDVRNDVDDEGQIAKLLNAHGGRVADARKHLHAVRERNDLVVDRVGAQLLGVHLRGQNDREGKEATIGSGGGGGTEIRLRGRRGNGSWKR